MVKICVRLSRFEAIVFPIMAYGSDCPSFTPYADWTCDQSVGLTPPERSHSPLSTNDRLIDPSHEGGSLSHGLECAVFLGQWLKDSVYG